MLRSAPHWWLLARLWGVEAGTWIDVLLVLAFILVGGVFAATEIALVSLRSGQVERLDAQGGRGHAVASLARDPNRFLSAVQIGVTVAGFFSAAFGASTLAPSFAPAFENLGVPAPDTVSLVVTTLVVSYLSLVLGELVPKRLALQRSVGVSKLFAPPLGTFATVMTPVIWLLSLSTNLLVRLLGGNPDAAGDEVDEEELRMMISGHEDIPEGERRLVDDVFEAGDRSLSEVMKPRGDVVFLRGDLTLAEAVAVIVEQPYTRYPVTGTSFDEVLGYLHLRDVLGRADDSSTTVAAIARELPVLPRTNRVLPSIDQLRSQGAHIALVVDEYGGTDGIVTLEDLMEELVGEIHDEYDTDAEIAASADPTTVDAGITIEEFAERTGVALADGPTRPSRATSSTGSRGWPRSGTPWWSRTDVSRSSRSTATASRAYAWVLRPTIPETQSGLGRHRSSGRTPTTSPHAGSSCPTTPWPRAATVTSAGRDGRSGSAGARTAPSSYEPTTRWATSGSTASPRMAAASRSTRSTGSTSTTTSRPTWRWATTASCGASTTTCGTPSRCVRRTRCTRRNSGRRLSVGTSRLEPWARACLTTQEGLIGFDLGR